MILLIDNYDSFVHNLARYFEELGCETDVARNDAITVDEISRRRPQAIVLSPGPCTPREAGICGHLVRELGPATPILGVCLGHQAIVDVLGGRIIRAPQPVHGQTSLVSHAGERLFAGLPIPLRAARYHSLIAEESSLPAALQVTARSEEGLIMALEHREWPVFGVQFHPESVLTQAGHRLLANFLMLAGATSHSPPEGEFVDSGPSDDFYAREIGVAPLPLPET